MRTVETFESSALYDEKKKSGSNLASCKIIFDSFTWNVQYTHPRVMVIQNTEIIGGQAK